jgi:uncharacterized OsmC-like protein/TusA-related sulfurtransferase
VTSQQPLDLADLIPDGMCDGGDLDCGSGLLLIIKKSMDPLPPGGLLEVRSREKTVGDDLPAWCRMVKHDFLGGRPMEQGYTYYYVRKGGAAPADDLEQDLDAARGYKWAVRVQDGQGLTAKIHARNHTFHAGQPADFSQKTEAPSAVDYLIASLAACLTVGYKAHAARAGVTLDAMEFTARGGLDNVLVHLGLEEEGSPALQKVTGTLFVTSPDDEERLHEVWQTTLVRSPVYQTLKNSVQLDLRLSIV